MDKMNIASTKQSQMKQRLPACRCKNKNCPNNHNEPSSQSSSFVNQFTHGDRAEMEQPKKFHVVHKKNSMFSANAQIHNNRGTPEVHEQQNIYDLNSESNFSRFQTTQPLHQNISNFHSKKTASSNNKQLNNNDGILGAYQTHTVNNIPYVSDMEQQSYFKALNSIHNQNTDINHGNINSSNYNNNFIGGFDGILYLASLCEQKQINIRIPETIICGNFYQPKYLCNEEKNLLLNNSNNQINQSRKITSTPIENKDLENKLCLWLQKNIEKSKLGQFVPISIKKYKPSRQQKTQTGLDFFVVSGMQSYNQGIKDTKGNLIGGDLFMIQRFIPSKDEYPQVFRGYWKKNKGYKFYKYTSIYPYHGNKQTARELQLNDQQQQSSGERNQQQEQQQNIKMFTFDNLTELYKKIQKLGNQRQSLMQTLENQPYATMLGSKEIAIDQSSLKNQHHMLLQKEITDQYSVVHQFELLVKEQKTFTKVKLRVNQQEYSKILSQIQTQLYELVKLLNEHTLKSDGLEIQKISVDFIEDYQDSTIYFLQIESYILQQRQVIQNEMRQQELIAHHRRNFTQTITQKQKFKCNGDYCYIQEQPYIPKHLAPIVTKLQRFEIPRAPKKTIILERENLKDNFKAYQLDRRQFKTMVDQELLLRKSLGDNEQIDVCPCCFHVYNYLEEQYYGPEPQYYNQSEQFDQPYQNHYSPSEEIKEDLAEENKESLEMNDRNSFDIDRAPESQNQFDYQQNYQIRNSSQKNNTESRFQGTLEETSPEDFNERETGFKIPSDTKFSIQKQTIISGQPSINHERIPSILSQPEHIQYYNDGQIQPMQEPPRPQSSVEEQRRSLRGTPKDQFSEGEFNPPLKYNIKPKPPKPLKHLGTSKFGGELSIGQTQEGFNKQLIQTFSVAQIIKQIQDKRASQKLEEANLSRQSSKRRRSIKVGDSILSLKQLNECHQVLTVQQTPIRMDSLKSQSMINPMATTPKYNKQVSIQVGDSLNFSASKPPLASIGVQKNGSFKQMNSGEYSHDMTTIQKQISPSYLETQNILKGLTQQHSLENSQIIRGGQSTVNELRLPNIVSDSPRSSQVMNHQNTTELILQIPGSKIESARKNNINLNSNRSGTSSKMKNSPMRMRSRSVVGHQANNNFQEKVEEELKKIQSDPNNNNKISALGEIEEPEQIKRIESIQSIRTNQKLIDHQSTIPRTSVEVNHTIDDLKEMTHNIHVIEQGSNNYEPIMPHTPPKLHVNVTPPFIGSKLNGVRESMATAKKIDSFFGRSGSQQEDEFLFDYVITNEEDSSILNSNPQLRSLIQNRQSMKIGSSTNKVNIQFSRNATTLNINSIGVKSSLPRVLKSGMSELDEVQEDKYQ